MGTVKDKFERDRAVLSEENKKLAAEKERVTEGLGRLGEAGTCPSWRLEVCVLSIFIFQ